MLHTASTRRPAPRAARALVVATYVAVVSGVTLPTPLYLQFQHRWSLTNGEVTGLYALYPVGVLGVLWFAGHWADQVGRRTVLALAIGCSAMSSIALLLAESPWTVAVARVLTGLGSGFAVNASNALLVELSPHERRRQASVLSTTVNQLGLGLGALVSGVLVQAAPLPSRLVFACHLVVLTVVAIRLHTLPETLPTLRWPTLRLQRPVLPPNGRTEFAAAALGAFAAFALCGLLAALAAVIARDELHTTNALASGGAVALVFAISGLSQPMWSRWSDVHAMQTGGTLLVVALATLTTGLAAGSPVLFLVGTGIGGAGVGGLFMGSLALVNHVVADAERARLTSTYLLVTFSGLVLPVVTTGLAADALGSLAATVLFGIVTTIAVAASMALLTRGSAVASA